MPRWNWYYLYGLKIDWNHSRSRWCQFQIYPYISFDTFKTVQMNRIGSKRSQTLQMILILFADSAWWDRKLLWSDRSCFELAPSRFRRKSSGKRNGSRNLRWLWVMGYGYEFGLCPRGRSRWSCTMYCTTRWKLHLSLITIYFEHLQGGRYHMRSSRGGRTGTSGTTAARSSTLWNNFVT